MKSILLKIVLPLVAVALLVGAGYLWFGKTDTAKQGLVESVKQSDYAFGKYFNAGHSEAKEAVLNHIEFLDRSSAESSNPSGNPFSVDALCWYVRLAMLEERNGGSGETYMSEATARCRNLGWADCSEENLRRQVNSMDTIARAELNRK